MKLEIQIKTGEYEYIQLQDEVSTNEDAVSKFRGLKEAWRGPTAGPGLITKEWNTVVDALLANSLKLSEEQWVGMSQQQQWFFNEVKKSRNRKSVTNLVS